ncbi:uncharacterized protein LOC120107543 [Phoenix dactylifera]|uniref:Uncharacterized protein LOC120107543 n=1 Tax=Phoenix dactylifera TaxID=42345 RepID=A0A8B8ZRA7_PHODC|nr:uncharacterized protein LOC120107543 [Phoenix dactylifera]
MAEFPKDQRMVGASNVNRRPPLVEVFSVRVDDINGEDPGHVYGTIAVTDEVGPQNLYNRQWDDPESIRPGHNVLLTGPSRVITADGDVTIDVHLMAREDKVSQGKEVSRGQIWWNHSDASHITDKALTQKVPGLHGSATVTYAVLTSAAEAVVEVVLIDAGGKDRANVYGVIKARNGIGESELFRKGSSEPADVRPWQLIRLSRSVVAVPLNSFLVVMADLCGSDIGEIANGFAAFLPQQTGTFEQNIPRKARCDLCEGHLESRYLKPCAATDRMRSLVLDLDPIVLCYFHVTFLLVSATS